MLKRVKHDWVTFTHLCRFPCKSFLICSHLFPTLLKYNFWKEWRTYLKALHLPFFKLQILRSLSIHKLSNTLCLIQKYLPNANSSWLSHYKRVLNKWPQFACIDCSQCIPHAYIHVFVQNKEQRNLQPISNFWNLGSDEEEFLLHFGGLSHPQMSNFQLWKPKWMYNNHVVNWEGVSLAISLFSSSSSTFLLFKRICSLSPPKPTNKQIKIKKKIIFWEKC